MEIFLDTKLLSKIEVEVIMESLLNTLDILKNGNEEDQALLRHFYIYIGWRNYSKIKKLFKRFEINVDAEIKVATKILQNEISLGKWVRTQSSQTTN